MRFGVIAPGCHAAASSSGDERYRIAHIVGSNDQFVMEIDWKLALFRLFYKPQPIGGEVSLSASLELRVLFTASL